jgi:hypothetical protein
MNRSIVTVGILAAFLVGCAASAMRFTDPIPVAAQSGAAKVHPNVVTGPCYKPTGADCVTTYHFVHGTASLTVATNCNSGVGCTFTNDVTFSGNAIFANTNYQCQGIGTDSNFDGVVFNAFQVSTSDVQFVFRNLTPNTITAGTVFNLAYTCDGA